VSGMSLREFTTQNIFEPLGMTHTHFRDDHEEVIKHDALGYEQDGPGKPFRMNLTNFDTAGATSLHTTVEDLQLWDENFYHPRVGGPELIQQMLQRGKLNSGKDQDYASGLVIGTYRGVPVVDHGGADAGYRSDFARFPDQHFSAAVLCNFADTNPSELVHQVADIVLAQDFKEPEKTLEKEPAKTAPVAMTVEQMEEVAGTYWNSDGDHFQRILLKEGKLIVDVGDDEYHPLKAVAESHFHVSDVPWGDHLDIHFVKAASGKPARIEQSWDGGTPDVYESVVTVEPAVAQLAEYAGAFVSEEIDPVFRLSVQDGKLTLMRLKNKPDPLRPTTRDVFVGQIGTIRFSRDANGRVSGFTLDAGRIQGFRFTRRAEASAGIQQDGDVGVAASGA
jgi:Beta-lactamase